MRITSKIIPVLIVTSILALGACGYFFYRYHQAQSEIQTIKTDPLQKAQSTEEAALINQVGKLIDLPTGETPTVATVNDITKLKNQPFFANAKNGDKVLIYTDAKKAILYDPIDNKIVDVAPVNIGSDSAQAISQSPTVKIFNGTTSVGLTVKLEAAIKKALPAAVIAGRENALLKNYSKTLVIPLTDSAQSVANSLANSLSASISALPAGEKKPDQADILVIAGKDQI